jgi:peptidoglycan/LPS O-acetylase OafA/YrhL
MTATVDPSARLSYRGHLDGIRAVSITLVVVQHVTSTTRWYVGAAGVGLFFALSGYLITGLLLDELESRGSVRVSRFYVRRFARLTPALLLMLAGGSVILVSVGAGAYVSDVVPSLLYVNNYANILAGGDHLNLAFGHTWSLAVEEHFYLAWPLVLIVARRRVGLRGLLALTLALCAATLAYRVVLTATLHPSALFFYSDSLSRADSLLYGCAASIAVRVGWRPPWWQLVPAVVVFAGFVHAEPLLIGGLLGSAVSGAACAMLVVGIDRSTETATVRTMLDLPPFRFLGQLSYSVYLWHLPLIATAIAVVALDRPGVRLVGVLASLVLAIASYRWVEKPVRDAVRRRMATPSGRVGTDSPIGLVTVTRSGGGRGRSGTSVVEPVVAALPPLTSEQAKGGGL